jgi:hypothetical protein
MAKGVSICNGPGYAQRRIQGRRSTGRRAKGMMVPLIGEKVEGSSSRNKNHKVLRSMCAHDDRLLDVGSA